MTEYTQAERDQAADDVLRKFQPGITEDAYSYWRKHVRFNEIDLQCELNRGRAESTPNAELKAMAAELLECNCISMLSWSGLKDRDSLPTVKTLCNILGVSSPSEFARQKVQAFEARKAEAKQPMTHIEELRQKFDEATKAASDAWKTLFAAIVDNAPLHVGDIIQLTDEDSVGEVFQIARVYAIDWGAGVVCDDAKYEVRKRTKKGWHSTVMRIGGLSNAIARGRYIQLTMDELIAQEKGER